MNTVDEDQVKSIGHFGITSHLLICGAKKAYT
jgi:hypothetical protein